jgi:hypothetical protein
VRRQAEDVDSPELQDMLTSMVEQLANLRRHVAELEFERGLSSASGPRGRSAARSQLLREIDAVEVLARGARERASKSA